MQDELHALDDNKTWTVVPLPAGKHSIGNMWVYKIKHDADGKIQRYKARLIAKGYNQLEGIDYIDTFSPVAKPSTVKVLLSLAAIKGWHIFHLDINNAFLNRELTEEVYMDLPLGYKNLYTSDKMTKMVCRLHRSIYGLKQSSRRWNIRFTDAVNQYGFHQCESDHTLFVKGSGSDFLALLVYVDDIIIAGPSLDVIDDAKMFLSSHFKLKDLGVLKYFLGLEVVRTSSGICIAQKQYTIKLLEDTGYLGSKPLSTPKNPNQKLTATDGELLADPFQYRRLVGRLLYLTFTRPDIPFAVHKLSQYISFPRTTHLAAAHHSLRYLKGTPGQGVFFSSSSSLHIKGFSDSDWGACQDTRKSISGYCTFLGNSLLTWKAKR